MRLGVETVLLLIVIAIVAAVFVWLGRALGDEWPPRSVADPLPQGEGVSGPLLESDRAVPLLSLIHISEPTRPY